jgi:hypothetical protein
VTLHRLPTPRRSPESPHECSEEDLKAQAVKAPKEKQIFHPILHFLLSNLSIFHKEKKFELFDVKF